MHEYVKRSGLKSRAASTVLRVGFLGAALVPALAVGACTDVGDPLFDVGPAVSGPPSFEQVTTVFGAAGCTNCHGTNAGLSLATVADWETGGDSGPAVVPCDADASLIIQRMEGTVGPLMPLGATEPIDQAHIDLVRAYIDGGLDNPSQCGVSYKTIAALFEVNCSACHVTEEGSTAGSSGNLYLGSEAEFAAGGASGPAFVPCDADASLVICKLEGGPDCSGLPHGDKLTQEEIDTLRAYIAGGGGDPASCNVTATCDDGEQNQDEEGIDCGGACPDACPTCTDGKLNQDEVGVDCGGACDACNASLVDYDTSIKTIWAAKGCANATSCHGQAADSAPRGFNFSLENMLKASSDTEAPVDAPLIIPCDADNSLLVKVLSGPTTAPDPIVSQMPYADATNLTTEELDLVKAWINQGANPVIDPTNGCPAP